MNLMDRLKLKNYPRGQYTILRVSGEIYDVFQKPTIQKLQKEIGCDCIDTVILDKKNMTVMIVDDTGMIDKKPVNPIASSLMWMAFGDGYPYSSPLALSRRSMRMFTTPWTTRGSR